MIPIPTSISELRALIGSRKLSAVEVTRATLARIAELDPELHAFLEVFQERALQNAADVDAALARGENPGPLAGIPVALKDNMALEWGNTTCGSKMLRGYRSPFTATAAQKLINAGAIVIGKTNLDEFAMGSSTEHSAFGPTRNPWDHARVPGGSSGGSAAAVAARMVPLALGSDTGGSIRQPASLCGIVGVKPTYGRVSRYGLVAFASSLDQIGPFATSIADAALALNILCGFDPHDATSAELSVPDFTADLDKPLEGLTIGVPRLSAQPQGEMALVFDAAVATYVNMGATIKEVSLPLTDYGIAAYYIVAPAEASSNLARFDGVRYGHRAALAKGDDLIAMYCKTRAEGFGPEVQRRIMLGTHVLSSGYYDAYYSTALKVRRLIKAEYDTAFRAGCHALLTPATPGPAFRIGEKTADPLAMYLEDVYTVGVNLAGLPAVTMPAGFIRDERRNLPVGVQLIAPAFEEARMLRIARQFEAATDWHTRAPGFEA
ncbi:MAG: Asp-tRNA(Asn)/Glu-tRNA(Gln) amidotransferase subunit GatA [Phycisphaerales bacterium]|nr:Asp-tRNA(Asn)/Glu-tRNA(Gln) amidotransferase subunit GatA [Phycisphaerales bacterium]